MADPPRTAVPAPGDPRTAASHDAGSPNHASLPVLGALDALVAPDLGPEEHVDQALAFVRRGIRTYLDAVGVIVAALSHDGRVLFVNRRGCELLGCDSKDEILGMDWIETFVPERFRIEARATLRGLWTGDAEPGAMREMEVVTRSGEERVVAWTSSVLRNEAGTIWAAVGSGVDVTERRHTEHRLARKYQAIEAAHDGIGILDLDGRAVYMNPALCDLTGYTLETLGDAGGPLTLFADPGAGRAAFLWAMLEETWTGEVTMRRRSGESMTVRLRVSVVRDEQGRASDLIGIHTDVTEQKQIERALHRSEARNRALVEALPDLVVLFTPDRIIHDVQVPEDSPSLLQEAAVGRSVREAFPPGVAAQLEEGLAAAVVSGKSHPLYLVGADGTHTFEARLVRVEGNWVLGIVRDVTEQRRLEAEVLRATDEERQRLGRDLHDGLGSHLVGLGMLVRSLAREARALAEDCADARAAYLADELEGVARMVKDGAEQARALAHGLNPVSLDRQGLAYALDRLAAAADTHTDLRCTFETGGDVPPLRSEIATQLYRIAQEALANALRHAQARTVTIKLGAEPDAVVLTMRDDGRGLDGRAREENVGLGLRTMAYRAHTIGATFELGGPPEGGTVVSCRLPLPRPDDTAGTTDS